MRKKPAPPVESSTLIHVDTCTLLENPTKYIGTLQVSDYQPLGPLASTKDEELAKLYEVIGHPGNES